MAAIGRRTVLRGLGVAGAGLAAAGPFRGFAAAAAAAAAATPAKKHPGYGPLRPVADERDGVVRLALPAGFRYRSFHVAGTPMAGGVTVPGRHDGMAAFKAKGPRSILVRCHEINGNAANGALGGALGGGLGGAARAYDPGALGGCVSVEVDGEGRVHDEWVSLSGGQMVCSGAPTPWGTYLAMEETVNGPDVGPDFTGAPNTHLRQKHGYVFEVPADGVSDAEPIRSMGRFAHEMAAVDPASGHVYSTEDNFNFPSGFYRYLPPSDPRKARRLEDGGTLQTLRVKGHPRADLSGHLAVGTTWDVEWVTIPAADADPAFASTPKPNPEAISWVGNAGRDLGAASFSRLEGCTYRAGTVFFVSTQGGAIDAAAGPPPGGYGSGRGQVFAYDLKRRTLTLVYESPAAATLDLPDNVVATGSGTLLLCEDGPGDNFLRGLTRDGALFDVARNVDPAQVGQEFAGATFAAGGKTLYVNIQSANGYSLAIWGPWAKGPLA